MWEGYLCIDQDITAPYVMHNICTVQLLNTAYLLENTHIHLHTCNIVLHPALICNGYDQCLGMLALFT